LSEFQGYSQPATKSSRPTRLIGMSGPPRSGKNTIAAMLAIILEEKHQLKVQMLALSTPMREVVYALLGRPYSEIDYELHKDEAQDVLGGKSIRQAMIQLSEEWVKPAYGKGFWATSMLERMWTPPPEVLIVTDMGFDAEVDVFGERFGLENVVYPQITRVGCNFDNDSRDFVGSSGRITSIVNDDDVDTAARRIYGRLVNQFHWKFD
jgi:hypothetical protein